MHLEQECLQEGQPIEEPFSSRGCAKNGPRRRDRVYLFFSHGATGRGVHLRIPCSCHCRDTRLECSCPAAPSYSPLVPARSDGPTRGPWPRRSWKKETIGCNPLDFNNLYSDVGICRVILEEWENFREAQTLPSEALLLFPDHPVYLQKHRNGTLKKCLYVLLKYSKKEDCF